MKFSIITCTRNSAKYLDKNIQSVLAQTFKDYEHVFIDAHSIDGTVEIIKNYQAQYPETVSFYQFPPQGISSAMNQGIEKARGEFIIHLHADDSFFDEKVLADVNDFLAANPELDWVYGLANVVEEDGAPVMVWPNKPWLHFHNYKSFIGRYLMKVLTFVPHQAAFVRRSVFERFGDFDETLTSRMDPDLWMRIRNKTKWSFFDRIICNFCVRPGAQSSSREKRAENMKNLEIVQKRYMNKVEFFFVRVLNKIRAARNKGTR